MQRFVITGGLGVGKTTLLNRLSDRVVTVAEPARELIAEHRDATGEPSLDGRPTLFLHRLVERSIHKYESVHGAGVAIYDRGVPDCIAYATAAGLDATDAVNAAEKHRYETTVFVAPPWRDIYRKDGMRRATFEQAEHFYSLVVAAYQLLGYEMVELPRSTVEERAGFVLAQIKT